MNASRELVPLHVADLSLFSKRLRKLLAESGATTVPSHVVLLNLLAKSAGHGNYQALRAAPAPASPDAAPTPSAKPIAIARGSVLPDATRKTLGHFDTDGRLVRWPTKYAVQQRALWALWARLPARRVLTEREVNKYLTDHHAFGDPATLRRELVNAKLLWRTPDCSAYRKEPRRPVGEVREFLTVLFEHTRPASNKGV
ncbi:hypothetical protein DSM104443_00505 [Usitatibacter rugosus]|uniref:DUF2087 domain-containing protein n=1 Tax=Usitatibacter rugosus TaxID=2732067 RepID=A0A6M4GQF3_9PROT|nr:DUF2087 domain-containing protein [Usitatibacter rugosus]QJR09461.1 hypothetical protein DSM104443_00505 [Usitatibacter rugosus]